MRRSMDQTAWIWLAGALAWLLDALANLVRGTKVHAGLAFALSGVFAVAWLFYRGQSR